MRQARDEIDCNPRAEDHGVNPDKGHRTCKTGDCSGQPILPSECPLFFILPGDQGIDVTIDYSGNAGFVCACRRRSPLDCARPRRCL